MLPTDLPKIGAPSARARLTGALKSHVDCSSGCTQKIPSNSGRRPSEKQKGPGCYGHGLFNLNPAAAYLVLARLGISNGKSQISNKIPEPDHGDRTGPSALEGFMNQIAKCPLFLTRQVSWLIL